MSRPTESLNEAIAHAFVESFDSLLRQLIVPNSHQAIKDLQMGPQDVRALTWLGRRDTCLMTEFAQGVGVPLSTATHLANRLVDKGVLRRERSEQDRRVVTIALSDHGRKLEAQLFALKLSRSRSLLQRLAPEEQRHLVALMQKALTEPATQPHTTKKRP